MEAFVFQSPDRQAPEMRKHGVDGVRLQPLIPAKIVELFKLNCRSVLSLKQNTINGFLHGVTTFSAEGSERL